MLSKAENRQPGAGDRSVGSVVSISTGCMVVAGLVDVAVPKSGVVVVGAMNCVVGAMNCVVGAMNCVVGAMNCVVAAGVVKGVVVETGGVEALDVVGTEHVIGCMNPLWYEVTFCKTVPLQNQSCHAVVYAKILRVN